VNALGDIFDFDSKKILAGILTPDGEAFADSVKVLYEDIEKPRDLWGGANTTIGCILTNARIDKCQANKLAQIAHNGYAQSIRPVHSSADGDTIFVMATGEAEVGIDALGLLATEVMARAINRAALDAEPAYGLKAARDFLS
ncbi:MAG: P1 family peptidase, partial [Eubacterium sp.]|nr:P1 family peptidase [Eubacterium sp.]